MHRGHGGGRAGHVRRIVSGGYRASARQGLAYLRNHVRRLLLQEHYACAIPRTIRCELHEVHAAGHGLAALVCAVPNQVMSPDARLPRREHTHNPACTVKNFHTGVPGSRDSVTDSRRLPRRLWTDPDDALRADWGDRVLAFLYANREGVL